MVSLSFPFWESYWLKMSLEKKKKKKNRTGWKTLFNSNSENRACLTPFKPSSTLHPEDPDAVAYLEGSGVPVK